MKDELCKNFTEYGRLKQQALRKLVLQELSSPLPASESIGTEGQEGHDDSGSAKKKRRRKDNPASQTAVPDRPLAEKETMNDTMRKLYAQGAGTGLVSKAERSDESALRRAREKAAMAAARREQGLPEPRGSGFQPEARPDERLEDLGGSWSVKARVSASQSSFFTRTSSW